MVKLGTFWALGDVRYVILDKAIVEIVSEYMDDEYMEQGLRQCLSNSACSYFIYRLLQ